MIANWKYAKSEFITLEKLAATPSIPLTPGNCVASPEQNPSSENPGAQ